jgi:hypothetical protein
LVDIDLREYYDPFKYVGGEHVEFHRSPARYKLIGGAMGGSKTYSGCAEIIALSVQFPGNRCAILRKTRTVLKRTTLVTFFNVCPPEIIRNYNKSDLEVTLINGSVILFLEADESKDPLFEKLKSLEIGAYFIDEASEVARGAHQALAGRLRWSAAKDNFYGILASNPEQCWLKEDFPVCSSSKPKQNHAFFKFLPAHNPFLPKDYINNLRSVLDANQQLKYIEGSWDITDDPLQLIPFTALKNKIATQEEIDNAVGEEALGVDVGELGNDKSILAFMRGSVGVAVERYEKLRIDEISEIVKARIIARKINANKVGIDAIGVGAGVWGNLVGAGIQAQRIISGEAASKDYQRYFKEQQFANLRAQMWWKLRMEVLDQESNIRVPYIQSLVQDLTAPRYKHASERKILVEPKEDIKKRIGRSPDDGDAFVMANFVRDFNITPSFSVLFGV